MIGNVAMLQHKELLQGATTCEKFLNETLYNYMHMCLWVNVHYFRSFLKKNAFPILSYLNSLSFLQTFNQQLMVIVLPYKENNINTKHHCFFLKNISIKKRLVIGNVFFSLCKENDDEHITFFSCKN